MKWRDFFCPSHKALWFVRFIVPNFLYYNNSSTSTALIPYSPLVLNVILYHILLHLYIVQCGLHDTYIQLSSLLQTTVSESFQ